MNFFKRFLKIFIGIAALIFVVVVFFFAMRSGELETASLKQWRGADLARRTAAAQIITASNEDLELLVQCVDKIATLSESNDMAVRDAVALCYTGIQVNKNK